MNTYDQAYAYYDNRSEIEKSIRRILGGDTPGYHKMGRDKKFRKLQDEKNLCEVSPEIEFEIQKAMKKLFETLISR